MGKAIKFRLADSSGDRVVEADFEDAEWAAILRFLECAERVVASPIARNEHKIAVNLDWREGVMSTRVTLPPDEMQEAFLLRMRLILLEREHTSFFRIASHLTRRITDATFRAAIGSLRRQYQGDHIRSVMQVRAYSKDGEEVEITSDQGLDLWLYSEPYHGDPDKRELLARLHQMMPLEASRAFFLLLLRDKALAAINLANLIRVLAGQQESFSFGPPAADPPSQGDGGNAGQAGSLHGEGDHPTTDVAPNS